MRKFLLDHFVMIWTQVMFWAGWVIRDVFDRPSTRRSTTASEDS